MDEQEFGAVLQYLQQRMVSFGFSDVNARIVSDLRLEPRSASEQVLRYLDALESELRLGTDASVRRIISSFRETVETDSGRPVDGLTLLVTGADRELFGRESVDLGVAPNLEELLAQIRRLRGELSDSREAEQGGGATT